MIFKVMYQENSTDAPRRENTKSLYIEADSINDVRTKLEENTDYRVEHVQPIAGAFLEYEQAKNPDFKVLTF